MLYYIQHCRRFVGGTTGMLINNQDWDYAYVYNNSDVYRITNAGRLDVFIRKQTLRWLGHVIRMENYMPQKQILFAKTQRKYALGNTL